MNTPNGHDEATTQTEAYTIRVPKGLADAYNQARGGRSIRQTGEEAIRAWVEQQKSAQDDGIGVEDLQESLKENLIAAVTGYLRSNPAWAEAALIDASFHDPVVSVYMQRVNHFHSEKKALSENFGPWLVERMVQHVQQGRTVRLAVESGTTLKAMMDGLGPALQRKLETVPLEPEQIQIVTNNFPGAESYEAHASTEKIGDRLLSDIVPCVLVPGRALRMYSAVVGVKAERYLREFCQEPQRKKQCVRIGLVVGNWVMLEGLESRAMPLARGAGHKSFKEHVFANCDEIYLISPLCKIFLADKNKSVDDNLTQFNRDLLETTMSPQGKGLYERVDWLKLQKDVRRVKLVTTAREHVDSIVRPHSLMVNQSISTKSKESYADDVGKPIEALDHFVYRHDAHSRRPFDDQLKIELPHKLTRTPAFRSKYFKIKTPGE